MNRCIRRYFTATLAAALVAPLVAQPQQTTINPPPPAARRAPAQPRARKPKLVVLLAIDQFRYDYLTRFRPEYEAGLARLLGGGAVFTNAHYEHFPTVTAVGHSTMLSGATPSISGIVGNAWFDRETGKQVTSVSDDSTLQLGGAANRQGASPRRLLVSTVGDELKMANGKSRVIGISSKDRSAILPGGRMADGSYWFDTQTGEFVSSTYYFPALPQWVTRFNAAKHAEKYLGGSWKPFDSKSNGKLFESFGTKADPAFYSRIDRSPQGNELLVLFAEAAIDAEALGLDDYTDVLTISFSANDRIGHSLGPDSPQVRDISIQTDRIIGQLLTTLDRKVGAGQYVVVVTADHGVAPMPELMRQRKMPGGRMPEELVRAKVQEALAVKYGPGQWVVGYSGPAPYLNHALIQEKKLDLAEVQNLAADTVRQIPHIFRVYTRSQLTTGGVNEDLVDRRVRNGFHYKRSSDLFIVAEPYWLFEKGGTSHGTPFNYDSHVPLIFYGPGIKAGRYHGRVAVNDIAPTLATMLEVETPSGAMGRVLDEMFSR